jgi:drug/metabolite transporter (DMT)-like permease
MIIWSGLGFLVAVFVFGAALLCNFAFDAARGAGYYSAHKWTIGIAMFIAAALSWVVGSLLRKRTAQTVIDKTTGKEIVLDRANHRLFFIPMYYWGPILAVIGAVLWIAEFIQ